MTNPRDGMDFEIANIPICSWPAEFRYCTELGLALSQMRVDSKPFLATVAGMEPAYWGCRGRKMFSWSEIRPHGLGTDKQGCQRRTEQSIKHASSESSFALSTVLSPDHLSELMPHRMRIAEASQVD